MIDFDEREFLRRIFLDDKLKYYSSNDILNRFICFVNLYNYI